MLSRSSLQETENSFLVRKKDGQVDRYEFWRRRPQLALRSRTSLDNELPIVQKTERRMLRQGNESHALLGSSRTHS